MDFFSGRKNNCMISAIILAKNEEENIIDCIDSLSFCGEIIVIDDSSSDRTADVAKHAGAKVYTHALENNFSTQRNFGLEKARGEWVLFVDADERVSKDLKNEIVYKTSKRGDINGYFMRRFDFMKGKMLEHGETARVRLLRLGKNGKGVWHGMVHEVWEIDGKTETLESTLLHYPHDTIDKFLEEINYYSDLRAKELYKKGVTISWFPVLAYPVGKFIQNYFVRAGFKDGVEGMIMAIMMSFHSFLVRGKLWQLWDHKISQ